MVSRLSIPGRPDPTVADDWFVLADEWEECGEAYIANLCRSIGERQRRKAGVPVSRARKITLYIHEAELVERFRGSGQTVAGFATLSGGTQTDLRRICKRVRQRELRNGWTLEVLRAEQRRRNKSRKERVSR